MLKVQSFNLEFGTLNLESKIFTFETSLLQRKVFQRFH